MKTQKYIFSALVLSFTLFVTFSLNSCSEREAVADVATDTDPQALNIGLQPCLNYKLQPDVIALVSFSKNKVVIAGNRQLEAQGHIGGAPGKPGKWNVLHPTRGMVEMDAVVYPVSSIEPYISNGTETPDSGDFRTKVNAKCSQDHTLHQSCANKSTISATWKTCVRDDCEIGSCTEYYESVGTKTNYEDDNCQTVVSTEPVLRWNCLGH